MKRKKDKNKPDQIIDQDSITKLLEGEMTEEEIRKLELERIKNWINERKKRLQSEAEEEGKPENQDEFNTHKEIKSTNEFKDPKEFKTPSETKVAVVEDKKEEVKQIKKPEIEEERNNFERIRRTLPLEIQKEINIELERMKNFSNTSSEFARSKMRIDYLMKLPWRRKGQSPINVEWARKILNEEHYGMEELKEEITEYICALNQLGNAGNEILLLSGPPGTGKTSVARQIAKTLNREFIKIPLGGLADEIYLRGSSYQYNASKPGVIIDSIYKAGHRQILILLDEIDKMSSRNGSSDGASALLDALDRESSFLDRFINIPFDLKDIIFIASANDITKIPPALYDRMTEIELQPYTKQEKIEIARRFILPKAKAEYCLQGRLKIQDSLLKLIAEEDSFNAGIRGMEKKIRKICRIAVKALEDTRNKSYTMTVKRATEHKIIRDRIISIISDYAYGRVISSAIDINSGKETLVSIESIYTDISKECEVIGANSNMYKEDLLRIWSNFSANRAQYLISESSVKYGALVVNVERLNYFGYDPNIRLALAFSLYSAYKEVTMPRHHAIIGDVSLLGSVRSNPLTKAHILNAINFGAKILFVPEEMALQMKDILKEYKIQAFGMKNLSQLTEIFSRLSLWNKISTKISECRSTTAQITDEELFDAEEKITNLSKDKDITFQQALDIYFKKDTDVVAVSAEDRLEELIGLADVKTMIKEIIAWKRITKLRLEQGLTSKNIGLHMVFTGNPGTGKTTVSKILGEILYEKGLVKSNRFIEVTRDDLVGKYVGHTEEKVKNIIKQALGGVLYIDEAHSLFLDSGNDYGRIVISTLVKEMEENRDNLIVIFSGYKDEMKDMVFSNPGLKERINFKINFADYTVQELVDIFMLLCRQEEYELEEGGVNVLYRTFSDEINFRKNKDIHFGNGRLVRNLFEKAKLAQAVRLNKQREVMKEDMAIISYYDLRDSYEKQKSYKKDDEKRIGFILPTKVT